MAEPSQDPLGPLRQLLAQFTGGGAPRQGPAPAPAPAQQAAPAPSVPAVTAGSAGATPPPERTLLERLRESVAETATPSMSSADSLAAFAAGMGGPRRQGFVQDLLAGIQAQNQFETARRGEMRQSLEAQARLAEQERKAAMEKAQFAEATSPESLTGRLRESQIRENLGRARYYEEGGRGSGGGGGGSPRGQITPQIVQDRLRRIPSEAASIIDRRYRDTVPPPPDVRRRETADLEQRLRAEYIDSLIAMGGAGAAIAEALRGAGQGGGQPPASTESIPPPQRLQYQPPR